MIVIGASKDFDEADSDNEGRIVDYKIIYKIIYLYHC